MCMHRSFLFYVWINFFKTKPVPNHPLIDKLPDLWIPANHHELWGTGIFLSNSWTLLIKNF